MHLLWLVIGLGAWSTLISIIDKAPCLWFCFNSYYILISCTRQHTKTFRYMQWLFNALSKPIGVFYLCCTDEEIDFKRLNHEVRPHIMVE